MIGILPAPRPDELVYGVVANYARDMYGEEMATPSRTGWLGLRSATQYGLCDSPRIIGEQYEHPELALDQLWSAHSLLPYALAAFPVERRDAIKSVLLARSCNRREVLAEICLIPIGARKTALGLRWCPECADDDRRRFAKPYWHRGHQLPGTAICIKHNLWLKCTNGVVRRRLYISPDDVSRSEVRPANRRKIPEAVQRIARLDADWLAAADSIDPMQLRCMLLFEFVKRSGATRKPRYDDGWRAIDSVGLRTLQTQWLDAGASSFWAMQAASLVRAAFALGRRDVIAAKLLPLVAYFNLGTDDLSSRDWPAELDALFEARGARVRSIQASNPEWRAQDEAARRQRRNEYKRRWRETHPEQVRAYWAAWRERQSPEALRERLRSWRQLNPEKHRANSRRWRQRFPERDRAKARSWRQRNPDRASERTREWRRRNRDKVREAEREWIRKNPEKVAAIRRRYRLKVRARIEPAGPVDP